MKVPATGGHPGRAETSSKQQKSTAHSYENPPRSIFILRLEPLPGIDGPCALRELLERAKRKYGLVCRGWFEECPVAAGEQPVPDGLLDRRAAWLAEAKRRRAGQ